MKFFCLRNYLSAGLGLALFICFCLPAAAALSLIRSSDTNTIYYVDDRGVRHAFPNAVTYFSWYGNEPANVLSVSNQILGQYPLGKNVTMRPGTFLIKVATASAVYAVEQGGNLRQLADESLAEKIYGPKWAARVVDVPDVFFGDYHVGAPLKSYELPFDLLFKDAAGKFYWRGNGAARPFTSEAAVKANNFSAGDAVTVTRDLVRREKPISAWEKNIFNPAAPLFAGSNDCEHKKLKAAVIFLSAGNHTSAELEKAELIKNQIGSRFAVVTENLSALDLSYPLVTASDNGYILRRRNDGAYDVQNELINSFYETNEDIFDFIIVFTNFKTPEEADSNEVANFTPITNDVSGIGRNILHGGDIYGSGGKLKGVIMMGNVSKYNLDSEAGWNETLNYVMHEILHQWGAYVYFKDAAGNLRDELLRPGDKSHWNYYAGFISPLGGSGWIDNGDGTFTNGLAQLSDTAVRKYSLLDLYLMGLIPYQLMPPIMYVVPETPGETGNTIRGRAEYVSISQIIAAHGQVGCEIK